MLPFKTRHRNAAWIWIKMAECGVHIVAPQQIDARRRGRRRSAPFKLLTRDEARRITSNIAELPSYYVSLERTERTALTNA